MIKDYAPKLRAKKEAQEREDRVMEIFSYIGMGATTYVLLKVAGFLVNLIWYTMEWGIYANV